MFSWTSHLLLTAVKVGGVTDLGNLSVPISFHKVHSSLNLLLAEVERAKTE